MNNRFDFLERLISHVEEKCSEFLSKYGLNNEWDIIKEMAEKEKRQSGITAFFDALTNGTVDKVVEKTNSTYDIVKNDFLTHYFK